MAGNPGLVRRAPAAAGDGRRLRSFRGFRRGEANTDKSVENKSAAGTRTRAAQVRAGYPDRLDYSGNCKCSRVTLRHAIPVCRFKI